MAVSFLNSCKSIKYSNWHTISSYHFKSNQKMNTQTKLPKFFIVDDDPFCRMRLSQHLNNLGFKDNTQFDNGIDCINKLNLQPDIIFLDYDMPQVNGIEVIKKINKLN